MLARGAFYNSFLFLIKKAAVAEFCHRPQCTSNFAENLYDSHLMMKDMLPDTSSTKSGACHKVTGIIKQCLVAQDVII